MERAHAAAAWLGEGWWRAIAPAVLALALVPFLLALLGKELHEPLFGDTLMMQYTAWGIRHGMRLYRDVGSTDGPFIHFTQAVIQTFFGRSDRGLRIADILLQVGGSALIGAVLAPRRGLSPRHRRLAAGAWALTAATVWLAYYLAQSWAATTNREAFYSIVGCLGMVALYAAARFPERTAAVLAFAGGFALMSMCFGKPTGIIFPCTGMLALFVREPESEATRRLRIRMALYGAGACVLAFVLALLLFGSVTGYFFWCIQLPVVGNKFVWRMDWLKLVFLQHEEVRLLALLCPVIGVAAIAWGLLPARAIGFVIAPLLHWLSFCAQARGFSHQLIPVVATANTLGLVLVANLWELGLQERTFGILATILLAFIGFRGVENVEASPYKWDGNSADWGKTTDTFADPEKRAGAFLKQHTAPDDRVFAYTPSGRGDNAAVVLLFAERRTASPFHYAPWLDPVSLLPQSEIQPNERERQALERIQRKTREIACHAVMSGPPPAALVYVTLDRMAAVCPPVEAMARTEYQEAAVFDDLHVLLRKPGAAPGR